MNNGSPEDHDVLIAMVLEGILPEEKLQELIKKTIEDTAFTDALVQSAILDDLLVQHVDSSQSEAHAKWLNHYLQSAPDLQFSSPLSPLPKVKPAARLFRYRKLPVIAVFVLAITVPLAALFIPINHLERAQPPLATSAHKTPTVATVSRSLDVEWDAGSARWSVSEPLSNGDKIGILGGRMELTFDSGAVMAIAGPASVTLVSENTVRVESGTVRARISKEKTGEFRVLTPSLEVRDLGTEFGVRVARNGETDIVVFEGKVNLTQVSNSQKSPSSRDLNAGEAVRLSSGGNWSRLPSVENDAFPFGKRMSHSKGKSPVIVGVSDNLQQSESSRFYQIFHNGLTEDAKAYVDRPHEWNGVTEDGMPSFLRGADYIATFCDDKRKEIELTVELAQPAMLYVFHDSRLPVPSWLNNTFEATGLFIGLDEGPGRRRDSPLEVGAGKSVETHHSIWQRRVDKPGLIKLGSPAEGRKPKGVYGTMYGVAAQPL